jgi:bacterioferritin-associated ferredoxin
MDKKKLFLNKNKVVCICKMVKYGVIVQAIQRGASTMADVERVTGAHVGECKGERCGFKIEEMLAEFLEKK